MVPARQDRPKSTAASGSRMATLPRLVQATVRGAAKDHPMPPMAAGMANEPGCADIVPRRTHSPNRADPRAFAAVAPMTPTGRRAATVLVPADAPWHAATQASLRAYASWWPPVVAEALMFWIAGFARESLRSIVSAVPGSP